MVIQPNMSSQAIVSIWSECKKVFAKYRVPLSEKSLEDTVSQDTLNHLLAELNTVIGSTSITCIEGG